jgi:hypothetical protein
MRAVSIACRKPAVCEALEVRRELCAARHGLAQARVELKIGWLVLWFLRKRYVDGAKPSPIKKKWSLRDKYEGK